MRKRKSFVVRLRDKILRAGATRHVAHTDDLGLLAQCELAVESMSPLTREVFLMHRVDDLSYGEIAERLSIDQMAVEKSLIDALQVLAIALHDTLAG